MFGPFTAKAREEKRLRIEREKAEKLRIAAEKAAARKAAWARFWFRVKLAIVVPFLCMAALLVMMVWLSRRAPVVSLPTAAGNPLANAVDRPADALSPSNAVQAPVSQVPSATPVHDAAAAESKPVSDSTWVDGHWRTNKNGTKSWVKGHSRRK